MPDNCGSVSIFHHLFWHIARFLKDRGTVRSRSISQLALPTVPTRQICLLFKSCQRQPYPPLCLVVAVTDWPVRVMHLWTSVENSSKSKQWTSALCDVKATSLWLPSSSGASWGIGSSWGSDWWPPVWPGGIFFGSVQQSVGISIRSQCLCFSRWGMAFQHWFPKTIASSRVICARGTNMFFIFSFLG